MLYYIKGRLSGAKPPRFAACREGVGQGGAWQMMPGAPQSEKFGSSKDVVFEDVFEDNSSATLNQQILLSSNIGFDNARR